MVSFSYNTDNFSPLPSNKASRQLTSVYIHVNSREQNSKFYPLLTSFFLFNSVLFEKMCLYVLVNCICFLLNQMVFSGLLLGRLFCHVNLLFLHYLVHCKVHFILSLLLLYVTVKTSVIVLCVGILPIWVVVMLIELNTTLLVYIIVLQISVSLLNSLPLIHILLISVHLFSVLLVIIFPVNVSRVKVW